jgi:glutamate formiminotransferase
VRSLAGAAVKALDLSGHDGAHPRFGVVDVVPFVPLGAPELDPAVAARDAFASWAADALGLPCFLYGPLAGGDTRSLPEVRRRAFASLAPDTGPPAPHPSAGAVAVGARPPLVAYNLWIEGSNLACARAVAAALRGPQVRALGFDLPSGVQVSCNLLDPVAFDPADAYDRVAALLETSGAGGGPGGVIRRAELVGLVPAAVLDRIPPARWTELDLSPDRTIEARIEMRAPGC